MMERHCPECDVSFTTMECPTCGYVHPDDLGEGFFDTDPRASAEALRRARVRYAEAFLRFRLNAKSDGMAHQQAVVETHDELTVLEAEHYVAKINAAAGTCGCQVGGQDACQSTGST